MNLKLKIFLTIVLLALIPVSFFAFNYLSKKQNETKREDNYNVIIVGAGTSGSAAAIQAARMGSKVALIEETDWVGGQMTAAGVSTMDEGYLLQDSGIYKEFIDNIKAYYGSKPISTCYWGGTSKCFEPSVGQKILKGMISQEKNIDLYLRTTVTKVLMDGNKVTGIATDSKLSENKITLKGKVTIDATETGEIIPMAGASYRIGNQISSKITDLNQCIQNITYNAVIRKYFSGVPEDLKIKGSNPPGGNESYQKMKAIFAKGVSKDGNGWYINGKIAHPYNWAFSTGYRGIPDSDTKASNYSANRNNPDFVNQISKTEVNMLNDYPTTVKYLEDKTVRKKINCEAKLRTMQFIYYMQKDLGLNDWSIANDEGYDTPYNIEENSCSNFPQEYKSFEKYFPVMPYIRESRRLIGEYTLTGKDIDRPDTSNVAVKEFKNSVAVGDYANDLHGCKQDQDLETAFESSSDGSDQRRIFQVPFDSFIPQDIDGFLVAEKNLSMTRLASAAARLQPITMSTGQAAGAIAALAVTKNVSPRKIDAVSVQQELTQSKARISTEDFKDIPLSSLDWPAVQVMTTNNILNGSNKTNFNSVDQFTRAQAAVYFINLFNVPIKNVTTNTFTDVLSNYPNFKEIETVNYNYILRECSLNPKAFCPNQGITRREIAESIAKGLNINKEKVPEGKRTFQDISQSDKDYSLIYTLYQKGLIDPCPDSVDTFCADKVVTRGQAAAILLKVLLYKQNAAN